MKKTFLTLTAFMLFTGVHSIHATTYLKFWVNGDSANVLTQGDTFAWEIDLASLTEAWPEAIVRECELQYQAARWPDGPPYDLRRVVCAAQLYLHFRWLGVSQESCIDEWRLEALRATGRQLGLI